MGPIERVIHVAGYHVPVRRLIGTDNSQVPNMAVIGEYDATGADIYVVANEAMLALPHKLFRAVVAHEIGHIAMKHKGVDHRRNVLEEIEADTWAASVVGFKAVRKALQKLLDAMCNSRA